jgi:hypothetical protein
MQQKSPIEKRGEGAALVCAALIALTPPAAQAARRSLPVREAARVTVEQFRREQPQARIEVDAKSGLVRSLRNVSFHGEGGQDAVAVADAFIARHRAMLLGDRAPEDLTVAAVDRTGTGAHITYQQQYHGLPVWGACFSVHTDAAGHVTLAQGTIQPEIALDTTPALDSARAIEAARAAVGSPALRMAPRATLGILGDAGSARLVYRIELAAFPPADWRVHVDATSGAVLARMNLLTHVDAVGLVVEENPFTTPDLVTRPLPNLLGDGVLHGKYANVGSFDRIDRVGQLFGKRLSRAEDHRFLATPDDPRFDEQMLYYHVNRAHGFLRASFGFTGRDHALPVLAHVPDVDERTSILRGPLNNAYYSPFMDALFFGDGTGAANGGLNPTSRDADVIYHEYSHAAIARIVPNLNGETEYNVFGAALNEGYADYFAATINNDAEMGEFASGHPLGIRNLANERRFPADVNHPRLGQPESHWTGQIWGGACWELRQKLGAQVTDGLVFGSLFFLPRDGKATLSSAAEALLQADKGQYQGAHADAIRQVMEQRGLLKAAIALPGF